MNVRNVLSLIALCIVIALIAACAPAPTPAPTAAPPTAAPAQPTTAATSAPAPTAAPKVGVTYKIGFASAVTGAGTFLGDPEQKAAQMMADRLSKSGGITGSDGAVHPVQITIKDDQSNPDTAVSIARGFNDQDKVVAMIMNSNTPVSLAVVPVVQEAKVPYVSMASSDAVWKDAQTGKVLPWVFKVPQGNADVGVWMVRRSQKLGAKTAGYLYLNSGYGKDVFANVEPQMKKAGINTVFSDSFESNDTQFAQMAGLKTANPDVVIVGGNPPAASLINGAIRNVLPKVPILHGHGVCTTDFIKQGGAATEGIELPCSAVIIADDLPASDPQKQVFMDFKTSYEKTYNQPVSTFAGHAWDGLSIVIDALKSLPDGLPLDQQRQKVRDYLETKIVKDPLTAGIFTMTPDDHYGLTPNSFTWFKVQNGKFVPFPQSQW